MNLRKTFLSLCAVSLLAQPLAAQAVKALYARPAGTYFFGLGLSTANTRGYFVPAYTPMKFRNLSQNAVSYNWLIETADGDIYMDESGEEPEVTFPMTTTNSSAFTIPTPTLTARGSDGSRDKYVYGPMSADDERTGEIKAGRWNEAVNVNRVDFHVGTLTMTDKQDFVFGTSKSADVHAIGNYFEKPLQDAVVRSVYVTFGAEAFRLDTAALKASGDTLLTMRAIRVERHGDELLRKDTVATATAGIFSTLDLTFLTGYMCYFLSFPFAEPLVMDSEMLYELDGFHGNPDMQFGIQSNRESDRFEQNGFVRVKTDEGVKTLVASDYTQMLTGTTAFRASLMFGLDMMFPVCHTNTPELTCNVQGGTATIDFETSYAINTKEPEKTLPLTFTADADWVTIEDEGYDGNTWARKLKVKYDPLPAGSPSRTARITVKAFGMADQAVTLTQGAQSGIAVQEVPAVSVTNEAGCWVASYPEVYRSMDLINAAGLCLEHYELSGETVSVAQDGLPAGLYMLVFRGESGDRAVKVIK